MMSTITGCLQEGVIERMKYTLDYQKYAELARRVAAEGSVLLRNEEDTLPLRRGQRVSVFGRTQFEHYKSGTGSGGMVNAPYVTNIIDSLKENGIIQVNEALEQVYREWLKEHPFDLGEGWAMEPWNQEEMPVDEELAVQAAGQSDAAIVVIGRTAGEDKDNSAAEGSYLLTALEEELLRNVCHAFKHTIVVLNVGNIIDMKWVDRYQPQAVLYIWQGGQEGGRACVDVLTGKVNPGGKLSDTIAEDIEDYPSTENFGDPVENFYTEDIWIILYEVSDRAPGILSTGHGSHGSCKSNQCRGSIRQGDCTAVSGSTSGKIRKASASAGCICEDRRTEAG